MLPAQERYPYDFLLQTWTPGIGRLSAGGWVIVAVYVAAALLCLRKGRRQGADRRWRTLGIVLFLLGAARLLDLAGLVTITLRNLIVRLGAYEHRMPLQAAFLALVAVAAGTFLVTRRRESAPADLRLSAAGTLLAASLIAVRACSFHYVDRLFRLGWGELRLGGAAELGCLALAIAGALRRPRSDKVEVG